MNDFYLLSYKVNGIKNIENDVELTFYKKSIDRNFDPSDYKVKAIFGENGTGKSAIITSVKVLKNLLINRRYLNDSTNTILLNSLINKKTGKFNVEIEFLCHNKDEVLIYKYVITIGHDDSKYFKILNEELYCKKNSRSKYICVYKILDGKKIETCCDKLYEKLTIENGVDTFRQQSFISNFYSRHLKNILSENINYNEKGYVLINSLVNIVFFALSLYVYLDDNDKYDGVIYNDLIDNYINNGTIDSKYVDMFRSSIEDEIINYRTEIPKKYYDKFAEDVNHIYEFVKLFKPSVKGIKIDLKEDKESYVCDLVFEYDDYSVNAAYESNGIKKLINLYKAISAIDKGSIVFIDEFDSNIHDVYLCRLIEYIKEYAKGQLCFTTQSITVMDVLEDSKKSLDFLTRDNDIVSWYKNSHYRASAKYKNGYIEKSPFNIEPFDFLKAFGDVANEK